MTGENYRIRNSITSRRIRWAGNVIQMKETRSAYKVLVGKHEAKKPLRRCRRRWENNIKFDFKQIGWKDVEYINVAWDRMRSFSILKRAVHIATTAL
jgi:hypothetical protein